MHVPFLRRSLQFLLRVFPFLSLILCYLHFSFYWNTFTYFEGAFLSSTPKKGPNEYISETPSFSKYINTHLLETVSFHDMYMKCLFNKKVCSTNHRQTYRPWSCVYMYFSPYFIRVFLIQNILTRKKESDESR